MLHGTPAVLSVDNRDRAEVREILLPEGDDQDMSPDENNKDKGVRVLTTGRMSVGKSSVINALWGRPEMLPTATRDCTQTNTLVRPPRGDEPEETLYVRYLGFDRACRYVLGSVHWHRVNEYIRFTSGPFGPRLDEMPPRRALEEGVKAVREAFEKDPSEAVLHDNLNEDVSVIEDMLSMEPRLDETAPTVVRCPFDERAKFLMGERRPDNSVAGTGCLMTQEWVEICRSPVDWPCPVPAILDTPWIPTIHDTRRRDLISAMAETAGVIVLVTLPEALEPEDWLVGFLRSHPESSERVVVVMNQADTIDEDLLFHREGFAEAFDKTRRVMHEHGMNPENIVLTVSWLAYLRRLEQTEEVAARMQRIQQVLARIAAKAGRGGSGSNLVSALEAARDPDDAGFDRLRRLICNLCP